MPTDDAAPVRAVSAVGLLDTRRIAGLGVQSWAGGAPPIFGGTLEPRVQLPLESTRNGSVFEDRFDASLCWYVPVLSLPADGADADFAFTAARAGVDDDGDPFDTATVTFTVLLGEGPDVATVRAARPTATIRPVDLTGSDVQLVLAHKGSDGSDVTTAFTGLVTLSAGTSMRVSFALLGPDVIVAYDNLTRSSNAILTTDISYAVWRLVQNRPRPWQISAIASRATIATPARGVRLATAQPTTVGFAAVRPAANLAPRSLLGLRINDGGNPRIRLPVDDPPPDPPAPTYVIATEHQSGPIAVAGRYATDAYRSRYTLTDAAITTPITGIDDLREFTVARSEFRELTSLGPVSQKYPSLRRLYFGQVSGTVVAVPATYGILRGSSGCQARADAVIDDSPTTLTGCRFQFSFALAPFVDPLDLARLQVDLATAPEASGRSLVVTLPTGLDQRTTPTFAGFGAGVVTIDDGPQPGTLLVNVALSDAGSTPAITNVNLFLQALTTTHAPMVGTVAIRLDDAYPTPVTTDVVLALTTTVGTDDVTVTIADDGSGVQVGNVGPLDLRLTGLDVGAESGLTEQPLDIVLDAGGTTTIPVTGGGLTTNPPPAVIVARRLELPSPLPHAAVFDYVDMHVQTVQQLRAPLSFNATAIDFAAAGITQIDLTSSLGDYPTLAVPALTLTPAHRVDGVSVLIPITALVTGMSTVVTIAVTHTDASVTSAEVTNDFAADPILVLTPASLATQPH